MKKTPPKKTAKKSPATAVTTTTTTPTEAPANPAGPPATRDNIAADDEESLHLLDRTLDTAMWSSLDEMELACMFFRAAYLITGSVPYCEGCTKPFRDEAKKLIIAHREELAKKEPSTKKN